MPSATDRVTAFHADYLRAWREAAPLFEREEGEEMDWSAFDRWRELTAGLDERHAAPDGSLGLGGSFSGDPEFAPGAETITVVEQNDDTALVQTTRDVGFGPRFREYELARQDDDWRIHRIGDYFDDPSGPFCPPGKLAELTGGVSTAAALRPLASIERQVDFASLFVERDVVDEDGDTSRIEVRPVGRFTSPSGILTVVDFGYEGSMLVALERAVEPGTYAVDLAVAFGRTAALRVTVAPGDPVSWHPAADARGGYVNGVDAGNLGVFDLPAYAAVSIRDKERAYDRWTMASGSGIGHLLAFGDGEPIGAVSDSGWGDGAYPAYWGADAQGRPVQLVIDYLVLSRAVQEDLVLPWSDGALASAELAGLGVSLRSATQRKFVRSTTRLIVTNPHEHTIGIEVQDASGAPVDGVQLDQDAVPDDADSDGTLVYRVPGRPGPGWTVHATIDAGRTLL